ncbi:Ligand-gated ion channel [Nesidiocoris tenuis]|uniref:Ligand-gated ion channel n=1 Tax=Nesidiocoris tenuis TaxID=355587 RepID=A0ABN7BD53_9HEMI|nr:Ligand-gated ion channel [Nesidiocoris tenuis]
MKVLLVLLAAGITMGSLPESLPSAVVTNFKQSFGNHFFLCTKDDAVNMWKEILRHNLNANVKLLSGKAVEANIAVDENQRQRVGVFLDLSCDAGNTILQQNTQLFNASYRWVLWSDDIGRTLTTLTPSRLEADSDVVVYSGSDEAGSRLKVTRITRVHYQAEFELIDDGPPEVVLDFKGFHLNVSMMLAEIKFDESFSMEKLLDKNYHPASDSQRRCDITIFLLLAEYYNFKMVYQHVSEWGMLMPNGSWTGMVGQVQRGETEFALASAKYLTSRLAAVSFIMPMATARICFTFLQPKLFGTYKALVQPLSLNAWLFLGFCSICIVVAFKLFSLHDKSSTQNDGWAGSFLMVFAAFSNQGVPDNSADASTRIGHVAVLMISFLIGVYYNTAILNGLILQAPNGIQTVDQLLRSDYRLAVQDMPYLRFEMTQNDSLTVRVRQKMERYKEPFFLKVEDGVQRMKEGKFAFYAEDNICYAGIASTFTTAQICSVTELEKYKPFYTGGVVRHNSPLREHLNRGIALLRERGIMDKHNRYWINRRPDCHWKQDALALGMEPLFLAYVCPFFEMRSQPMGANPKFAFLELSLSALPASISIPKIQLTYRSCGQGLSHLHYSQLLTCHPTAN